MTFEETYYVKTIWPDEQIARESLKFLLSKGSEFTDKRGFYWRKGIGRIGEILWVLIVQRKKVFACEVEVYRPDDKPWMTFEEKQKYAEENALTGDCRIKTFNGAWSDVIYVDAKNGSQVAENSLRRFTKNAWFAFNVMSISKQHFYYAVVNNDAFQLAVHATENKTVKDDGDTMYDVHFSNNLNKSKYPGLEFPIMDPKAYEKGIWEFMIELEKWGGYTYAQIGNMIKEVA